jgi:hypothetical protein
VVDPDHHRFSGPFVLHFQIWKDFTLIAVRCIPGNRN